MIDKRLIRYAILMLLMLHASHSVALINGKEFVATAVATLRISIQHEHFLRSINQWEYYESKCSAVIVGTRPLTLLTAAHCLKEARVDDQTHLPAIQIVNPQQSGIHAPALTKAFYRPYEAVVEDVNLDIAVLVFSARLDKQVVAVPIGKLKHTQANSVFICGYGRGYLETDPDNPRCGEISYIEPEGNFSLALPTHYKAKDEMLYIKSEAQFGYTQELSHASKSLIATHRINQHGQYDVKLPMVTEGDSGGPWLIGNQQQPLEVVAISTLVERFYNKNVYWGFFDRDTPLSDYPYIGYGLKLHAQAVKSFLMFCQSSGADLRFTEE